jgi:hypothetical protein
LASRSAPTASWGCDVAGTPLAIRAVTGRVGLTRGLDRLLP